MILNATIAANNTSSELELISRLLEAHLFQYFESDIKRAILRERMRETVAKAPPCEIISTGKDVCVFEMRATIPI
jgi:hypothetical protein